MEFHIMVTHENKDWKIASFENEYDRDYCLDALREHFSDCVFISKND